MYKYFHPTFTLALFVLLLAYSCNQGSRHQLTPSKYLNHTSVSKKDYTRDSNQVVNQMYKLLKARVAFFHNSAYSDSTELIVDTILYSPGFDKLASLIMTKNPTYRQLKPNTSYSLYFDATCYVGVRSGDSLKLKWLGPSFTNSYDKGRLSEMVRTFFFTGFAGGSRAGNGTYQYNLDDLRFWDDSLWRRVIAAPKL